MKKISYIQVYTKFAATLLIFLAYVQLLQCTDCIQQIGMVSLIQNSLQYLHNLKYGYIYVSIKFIFVCTFWLLCTVKVYQLVKCWWRQSMVISDMLRAEL